MAERKPAVPVSPSLIFVSPESISIRSASYDPVSETMTVHFQHGKSYDYDHCPLSLWVEFEQATSKGRFYTERIRPMFAGKLRQQEK